MNNLPEQQEKWLQNLGINNLNDMQQAAGKAMASNEKLILLAETGSGKTVAFLLPLLQSLDATAKHTQALIMVPSRELALQIESVMKKMQTGFKITACYGGHKREIEENNLKQAPAIVVGTAGRMADHIRRGNIDLKKTHFLVLDEFDKILELGFVDEMAFILAGLPAINKKMLTSATASDAIPDFAAMDAAETLNFLPENGKSTDVLRIYSVQSKEADKLETLLALLCVLNDTSTVVLCNHRDAVERTSQFLNDKGIVNVFYHGGMEQQERETALCKFRNSSSNILVTTDLASRGLDVANIRSVVHYHLPLTEDAFTHRNGRTARMDATGNVYLLVGPEENIPAYGATALDFQLPENSSLPEKPKWSTLFIAAGKKDKINKIDIVGFLSNVARLKKDDIGLIEVKDFSSFVAIRKSKMNPTIEAIKNEKIKNKKVKMAIAR
jgi:ATP-independent RNA helicase DbpA